MKIREATVLPPGERRHKDIVCASLCLELLSKTTFNSPYRIYACSGFVNVSGIFDFVGSFSVDFDTLDDAVAFIKLPNRDGVAGMYAEAILKCS